LCCILPAAVTAAGYNNGTDAVRVAVHSNFPPYYSLDENGKPTGFGVDLFTEIAERADLKTTYQVYNTWVDIFEAVKLGRSDVIPYVAVGNNPQAFIDFSRPIKTSDMRIFVKKETKGIYSLIDLADKLVGISETSPIQQLLEDKKVPYETFISIKDAFRALLDGRIDGVVCQEEVAWGLARDMQIGDRIKSVGVSLLLVKNSIGIAKDNVELFKKVDEILDGLLGSDKFSEISDRWQSDPFAHWSTRKMVSALTRIVLAFVVIVVFIMFASLLWRHMSLKGLYGKLKISMREREGKEKELREKSRALVKSEEWYRVIVEDIPALICRFLPGGQLTFVNNGFCKYINKKESELIGHDFFSFFLEEEREKVRRHFSGLSIDQPTATFEFESSGPDGRKRWQEWTGHALFDSYGKQLEYQAIGRDITERIKADQKRVRLEKQLQQAQKMQAIGTLAGGIAHDFNNILGTIIGSAEMAGEDIDRSLPVAADIDRIIRAGKRARDLVRQILTFSRPSDQEHYPLDLVVNIKEVLKLLKASLPSTIEVRTNLLPGPVNVLSTPVEVQQIMTNLCNNAAQAMQTDGGVLEINLDRQTLTESESMSGMKIGPGDYLKLSVSDTGKGIEPEDLGRIFEPFFTTNETGEGIGLGLSIVHGLVSNMHGAISVASKSGKGTLFTIYLPEQRDDINLETEGEVGLERGDETILLVDDEQDLLDTYKRSLGRLGYNVTAVDNSMEALELFRSSPSSFDLVFSDLTMPVMTGMRLAQEILRIRPDVPFIIWTGREEHINSEEVLAIGIKEIMIKPIDRFKLAKTIRKVLSENRSNG